jgi:ABC-type Na+ efflux pump permease subunit
MANNQLPDSDAGGSTAAPSVEALSQARGAEMGRFCWREVGLLYRREMRAAFRERAIVVNSILLPILLYPLILWLAFTGIMFVQGQTEGYVSRVVVADWPPGHPGLRRAFERDEGMHLWPLTNAVAEVERAVRDGRFEALVQFKTNDSPKQLSAPNFSVTITCNESRERSLKARDRVRDAVESYRQAWLKREASRRGISSPEWQQFGVALRNLASGKQLGAFILGLLLPILFVVMVAMGCFYPAVDATAGERERNTWETLMSTSASRSSIVTAKYLYVASLGGMAGVLNVMAMLATVKPLFAPLLEKAGGQVVFSVPWGAIPVLILAAALMAGFVAAGMMVFAAFARTFKEGQAMITPFYLVMILPLTFLQVPGLKFTLALAFVPVVNITMMVRSAVSGVFPVWPMLITLLASLAVVALCLKLAMFVLQFEDVMLGSYNGSLGRLLKERLLRVKPENSR